MSELDVFQLRADIEGVVDTVRTALQREGLISVGPDNTVNHCTIGLVPILKGINKVLYDTMGFRGNLEDYYDPDNRCAAEGGGGGTDDALYGLYSSPVVVCVAWPTPATWTSS